MSRNIVICCDGTNSQLGKLSTNVRHLYDALPTDGPDQVSFYQPGVGTFGARFFGINIGHRLGKLLGAGFGYGVQQNVIEAYQFVIDHFQAGDRLFILGFSRGAFTARTLAALIDHVGLLDTSERDKAKSAVRAYLNGNGRSVSFDHENPTRDCAPYFVGVWETVAALGLILRLRRFHNDRLSPGVTRAVQALAIDERRRPFKPTLWNEHEITAGQSVDQVWFAGVHSDVGGGYAQRGLADITLRWMMEQAESAGLTLKADACSALHGDPTGRLHHSYHGAWRLLGKYVRRPDSRARFDASVATRLARVPGYDPINLPGSVRSSE